MPEAAKPEASKSTALVSWKEQMAKLTAEVAEAEKPSGVYLSFKSGVMSINDVPVPGNRMPIIVLDSVFENKYYEGRYNPNKIVSPTCWAIAREDSELAPNKELVDDQQSIKCEGCERNEWGSDPDGGRGKACKNTRRVAIIHADALKGGPAAIKKADVIVFSPPVTSVKNYSAFANQVATVLKVPPLAIEAEIAVEPDAKNQFSVHFRANSQIEDESLLVALLEKRESIKDMMMRGYPKNSEIEQGAAPIERGGLNKSKKY